jgi:hypothetical protein
MITNWPSKKEAAPELSSTEAEYQAISECAQESMLTCSLFLELTKRTTIAIIYEGNLGAIFLKRNQQVSGRTKHIYICHHYVRALLERKLLELRFQKSESNSSDIVTKNTTREIFEKHTTKMHDVTLDCWEEDVKNDSSVMFFGENEDDEAHGQERIKESKSLKSPSNKVQKQVILGYE